MRVWNGSAWQTIATLPDLVLEYEFTATAGQTSYTFTGGYRVGYLYVWVNGVMLADADITATNGTTITFNTALTLNDEVRVMTFKAVASVTAEDINAVGRTSSTGSAKLPTGTTAQRDGSPAAGYIRFNTTDSSFEGYDGSAWGAIGGGGATKLIVTNRSASAVEVPLTNGFLAVTNRAGSTVNVSVT